MNTYLLKKLDKLGAILSFACALHCILQPVLLIFLPLVGLGFIADPLFESIFISATIILATIALFIGFNYHRERKVFTLLIGGIILIVMSRFIEPEPLFAVSGALSITFAHIWNLLLRSHLDGDDKHSGDEKKGFNSEIQIPELTVN